MRASGDGADGPVPARYRFDPVLVPFSPIRQLAATTKLFEVLGNSDAFVCEIWPFRWPKALRTRAFYASLF